MFVASVSAFAAGVYLGTFEYHSIASAGAFLLIVVLLLPLFLRHNLVRISGVALIAAFFLTGMLRVSLTGGDALPVAHAGPGVYGGTVIESSRTTKTIRIDSPATLHGSKAIVRSEEGVGIGDTIVASGTLKELTLTFKNPGRVSLAWIKRREGILYEIRGNIIAARAAPGMIERIRRYCSDRIDASGALHRDVIKALTIGDTTGLDETVKDLFLRTGTTHILSISGSHIAVVTALIFSLSTFLLRINPGLRQKGSDRRYAAVVAIPFAVAFMLVSGSSLPAVRATIMAVIYMVAIVLDRSRHVENGLFLSALVILIVYPFSLFSPSFQLTFLSVLFIILANKAFGPAAARMPRYLRWPASMVLVTAAATAGTLPVVLYHFYGFNPLSMVHNLIAVPLMCTVATPLSLAGVTAPFGGPILRIAGLLIEFTTVLLRKLDWGYIYPIIRPNLAEALLYLSGAALLLHMRKKLVKFALLAFLLPIALVTAGIACHDRFHNKELCISFIDVGLGDAMLIEAPHGIRLLVDGGGFHGSNFDIGRSVIAPYLLARKIVTLDYVINTHPHQDHCGGLQHVLQYFDVRNFGAAMTGPEPYSIRKIIAARKIPFSGMRTGDTLRAGNDLDIHVLHALPVPDNMNDSSLVLKLAYGGKSFLLTGDIGEDVERSLIGRPVDLKANVLKVPHHGSRYSSTAEFIRTVRPDIAILSAGPGIRGIPSDEALARYRASGIPVYRTDRDGCVRVCTDGRKMTVSPFAKPYSFSLP